jgi:inhibitor of KinA
MQQDKFQKHLGLSEEKMLDYELIPLSENALVIKFGEQITPEVHQRVRRVFDYFIEHHVEGIIEVVPAYTTVTVYYNPLRLTKNINSKWDRGDLPFEKICTVLNDLLSSLEYVYTPKGKEVVIPVCYGEEFGPDLEEVARRNQLTPEEVIDIHTNGHYLVYMIGFAPGFAYLGGMSEKIAAPRKDSPRLHIPAGSVGIAGMQTGVYPIESPGGWRLIGRTPLRLFRPHHPQPSLLQAGDRVRFQAITKEEYKQLQEENNGDSCYS